MYEHWTFLPCLGLASRKLASHFKNYCLGEAAGPEALHKTIVVALALHPELGELYAEGQKQYGQGGWIQSLITCPLTVYQADRPVGKARVAYRDSMLAFPFKALRLVDERHAYQDAAS